MSIREIYSILVLRLKLNPKYVLDEMSWAEINTLLKYDYYAYKDSWEQARMISYLIAQVNSKKRLQFSDIMEFPWEKENEDNVPITKEELNRLRIKAKQYLKKNGGDCDKTYRQG